MGSISTVLPLSTFMETPCHHPIVAGGKELWITSIFPLKIMVILAVLLQLMPCILEIPLPPCFLSFWTVKLLDPAQHSIPTRTACVLDRRRWMRVKLSAAWRRNFRFCSLGFSKNRGKLQATLYFILMLSPYKTESKIWTKSPTHLPAIILLVTKSTWPSWPMFTRHGV